MSLKAKQEEVGPQHLPVTKMGSLTPGEENQQPRKGRADNVGVLVCNQGWGGITGNITGMGEQQRGIRELGG